MAMAALDTSCCLVGPVPFNDVTKDDGQTVVSLPAEHADILSTLPSIAVGPDLQLRQYQGVWLRDYMVAGMISVQRRFMSRPGDVLLASPPKCGTTWLKALAFATMARTTYPPSDADHPLRRLNPHQCVPFMENLFSAGQGAKLEALPSPRLLHTHMHYSMLPPSLADCCKMVYVCREPKDMLVSMWHFLKSAGFNLSFPDLFELACHGQNPYGPIWDHVLGYWAASTARPERVMFLRYEEMLADPVSTVRQLAGFLGVPFTAAEEAAGTPADIAEMCSIDALRSLDVNKSGNNGLFVMFGRQTFFRKGVVGDWVNHMTPEMARRIDAIVDGKLRGSGLAFTPVGPLA
uniref:Uncharacterized protein n=1 Tax=Avena sativa TaxID=4498 RepID=A0ACD6A6J5_AVESA